MAAWWQLAAFAGGFAHSRLGVITSGKIAMRSSAARARRLLREVFPVPSTRIGAAN